MTDYMNKIISVILAFVMLVVAPLVISYQTTDMLAKRAILNDVTAFIDKAQDTYQIDEDDLNKLYMQCNSHGISVDVKVKRLIRTAVTKNDNHGNPAAKTVYYAVDALDDLKNLNPGDTVQVNVSELATTPGHQLVYRVLRIDEGNFEFSLAGVVG